ncbi:hypothetical protein [Enteractinococcus helveticum]|uniref:hypothetical protein n=1 Tax=Enteractinococcus helveticum TaxID=1837282 RepID=UPI000A5BEAA3|nr:hypothetical protein [Enteractinococcus helveticum]
MKNQLISILSVSVRRLTAQPSVAVHVSASNANSAFVSEPWTGYLPVIVAR